MTRGERQKREGSRESQGINTNRVSKGIEKMESERGKALSMNESSLTFPCKLDSHPNPQNRDIRWGKHCDTLWRHCFSLPSIPLSTIH